MKTSHYSYCRRHALCLCVFLTFFVPSFSQHVNGPDSLGIYASVEQMPEYPGGTSEMVKFIQKNFAYSECSGTTPNSKVMLRFVIAEDGFVAQVSLLKSAGTPEADKKLLSPLYNLDKFKPALHNGSPVKCYLLLPIIIEWR